MGYGKILYCPQCNEEKHIIFGVGFLYPTLLEEAKAKALNGELGKEWQELASSNVNSRIETEYYLYYCSKCNCYENESSYDMYYPINDNDIDILDKEKYKLIKKYDHLCPKCNKPMKEHKSVGNFKLKCNKCDSYLIKKNYDGILWD